MTLPVREKESSLGIRIYLYIIALVCLSANVWFSYELDKQQEKRLARASQITQEKAASSDKDKQRPLVAALSPDQAPSERRSQR